MLKAAFLHRIRYTLLGGRIPEGKWGLRLLGHRLYVGGRWCEIGKFQFDYMLGQGLKPEHCFLDVGCGALRGGVHFIRYLSKGNYLGLDKERQLIDVGIRKELGKTVFEQKCPEFVVSDSFEFERFSRRPQYALALSLFTHLSGADIEQCLEKLRAFVEDGHEFHATFFQGEGSPGRRHSHSLDHVEHTREEMTAFGQKTGWKPRYVGSVNHPRSQMMMKYVAE